MTFDAPLQMVLLLQMDITARAEMEKRMAALTETQLNMLEQVGGLRRCLTEGGCR